MLGSAVSSLCLPTPLDNILTPIVVLGYDGNARLNDMWTISLSPVVTAPAVSPGVEASASPASATQRVWEEVHYFGESPPTCCKDVYRSFFRRVS